MKRIFYIVLSIFLLCAIVRCRGISRSNPILERKFLMEYGDMRAVEWKEVFKISTKNRTKLCIKVYEILHNVRVGKLLYSPQVSIYARDTVMQPVFLKDTLDFKKIRALGCTLRSGVFTNYKEGPRNEFFVRPSVTPGKLMLFTKNKMNVFFLKTEIPGIKLQHYMH